jgi:hypothetical protein
MSNQTAFLIALAATLVGSGLIIGALWRPLHGILVDLCGTQARARFWCCYTSIMLILVPLAAVLLGRSDGRAGDPVWVMVMDRARWAVIGLILALFVVALGIGAFIRTRASVMVSRDQIDDLQRLLARVEEVRARQVLRRVPEPPDAGAVAS